MVRLLAAEDYSSRSDLAVDMAYNLDKKLKEFEFERKQVLHHLALLDANIATLKRAIELTQQESDVALDARSPQ